MQLSKIPMPPSRSPRGYRETITRQEHADWAAYLQWRTTHTPQTTLYALTTKATAAYTTLAYQPGDALLLGAETRGLPPDILATLPASQQLRIPHAARQPQPQSGQCGSYRTGNL